MRLNSKRHHFLELSLLILLAFLGRVVAIPRSALVFTDVNFDDLLAIHLLSYKQRYKSIVAVISGVNDYKLAHRVLQGFHREMLERDGRGTPLQILYGDRDWKYRPVPHEAWWGKVQELANVAPAPKLSHQALDGLLSNSRVDVFLIAPLSPGDSTLLLDHKHGFSISFFHVTHGYNTAREPRGGRHGSELQAAYVKSIAPRLAASNDEINIPVVITDKSRGTWLFRDGGTLPFSLVADRYPWRFVEAALWDPYPLLQVREVSDLMAKVSDRRNLLKVWTLSQDWTFAVTAPGSLLRRAGYRPFEMLDSMQYARAFGHTSLGTFVANHYRNLVTSVILPFLERHRQVEPVAATALEDQFRYGVLPLFSGEGAIAAYDANHVLAVIHAVETHQLMSLRLVHPEGHPALPAELHPPTVESEEDGWKIVPKAAGWAESAFREWLGLARDGPFHSAVRGLRKRSAGTL